MILFETKTYAVVVGMYPEGEEYPVSSCYHVQNKRTAVIEYYVNSLPKAIYLAQESENTLDTLLKKEQLSHAQLSLIHDDSIDNVH